MPASDPLDDVAFLARSAYRVEILRLLADGPRTRRDLHEETGISQPTLGRVLGPFQDRNWVERRGQQYALTSWGELLTEDFTELLDTVDVIQRLGDVVTRLPTGEMPFDVREFVDATVTTPTDGDAFNHVRRLEDLLYSADRVRNVATSMAPGSSEDYQRRWETFFEGDQQVEAVVPATVLEAVADEALEPAFREALDLDRVEIYRYEGSVSLMLAVVDGTAVLAPTDEHGTPTALVETENETIRSWVDARIDEYRDRSTKLAPADFA